MCSLDADPHSAGRTPCSKPEALANQQILAHAQENNGTRSKLAPPVDGPATRPLSAFVYWFCPSTPPHFRLLDAIHPGDRYANIIYNVVVKFALKKHTALGRMGTTKCDFRLKIR